MPGLRRGARHAHLGKADAHLGIRWVVGIVALSERTWPEQELTMPLNPRNTRTFHRCLYAGILETVTLLKRGDDQKQGTVRAVKLFQCRRRQIQKTGQTIQGDMVSDHTTEWMIPKIELDRVGVAYLNNLDRIVDKKNRHWQPESPTTITVRLFENYVSVACLRVDPPED